MRCSRCKGRGTERVSSGRRRPCRLCAGDGRTCEGVDGQGDPCGRPVAYNVDGEELCSWHSRRYLDRRVAA